MGYMPYPWEKGFFPTAIETWFNEGLDRAHCWSRPRRILRTKPGPHRRLRAIWRYASVCRQLRDGAANPAAIRKVTDTNSIVGSGLFSDPGVAGTGVSWVDSIAHDWFGMEKIGADWHRQTPATWVASKSLGHWNGYFGNVELIVCETLQRMLELSIGVDHLDPASLRDPVPTPSEIRQLEDRLRHSATHVWPVYMYLSCPNTWFESWVTWQCHDTASALRGQVTVVLSTPGHDRPVTPSPLDLEYDRDTVAVPGTSLSIRNPYYLRGVDQTAPNRGYQGDYVTPTNGAAPGSAAPTGPFTRKVNPPRNAGVAKSGPRTHHQGMWIVTHANHDSTVVWNNFPNPSSPNWGRPDVESWDLPPFAVHKCAGLDERRDLGGSSNPNALTGMYDVVVIQPASQDGGVW